MMQFISPLRYPGGKGKLGPFFARLLAGQSISIDSYAEPYAGGAGAGLYLLSEGYIETLTVNDLNPGIAAFWRAITRSPERFVDRIENEDITIDAWHRHRATYLSPSDHDDESLGFSTFFLNRCNRSGILGARPIGGLDQLGRWRIDARFNRRNLSDRVRCIAKMSEQITVTELPALEFVTLVGRRGDPVLMYVDPPYLVAGEELYMSLHSWDAHEELARALSATHHPWILTYDVDERVRRLYPNSRCLSYSISHTAHAQRVGHEYMLFSRGLRVADVAVAARREGTWVP